MEVYAELNQTDKRQVRIEWLSYRLAHPGMTETQAKREMVDLFKVSSSTSKLDMKAARERALFRPVSHYLVRKQIGSLYAHAQARALSPEATIGELLAVGARLEKFHRAEGASTPEKFDDSQLRDKLFEAALAHVEQFTQEQRDQLRAKIDEYKPKEQK